MIRQGVEDPGTGKYVEADKQDVVGEQHEPAEFIGNPALSKDVVSKITYCAPNPSVLGSLLSCREP